MQPRLVAVVRVRAIVVALALAAATPAFAAPVPSTVTRAEQAVATSVQAWRAAGAELATLRARYDQLGRRIDHLKAKGAKSGDPTLEGLLRESLAAGRRLEALARAEDERARAVRANVSAAVRAVDTEIARLKPGLKTGSTDSRAEVARTLKSLIDLRADLRDRAAALDRAEPAPARAWQQYEVAIDPLDGPDELREKADFIEDTRDKLVKKQRALRKLLGEARQEREIARAASRFQTDARHFDEELRTGRVTRQESGAVALATNNPAPGRSTGGGGASNVSDDVAPSAGGAPAAPPPGQQQDPANRSPSPQPPPADGAAGDPNSGFHGGAEPEAVGGGGGSAAEKGTSSPPAAVGAPEAGSAAPRLQPKQIDPDVLLNLRVEELDAAALDLGALESMVGDLERLDSYLSARAREIRRRAAALERDEARTLGDE